MKMDMVLVIVERSNRVRKGIWFENEEIAKNFIIDKYMRDMDKAPFYDPQQSYISDDRHYAQVRAGMFSTKMILVKDFCHARRWSKKRKQNN